MSKEVVAGLVGLCALALAAVIKGCFDIYMKHIDVRAEEKREDKDELNALREELEKVKDDRDEWRSKYWAEFEKRITEKVVIIGSPLEVEQQKHALETYHNTIQQEPTQEIKSYLEIEERYDKDK